MVGIDPNILYEDDEMVDFDKENEEDSKTAMDNLRTVQCPFNKEDIEFWFSQLEDQLTLIGVKKQWTKKIALVRFLPPDIQIEVKSLLKMQQTAAGDDIYLKIKTRLLKLFGPKPEDAYMRAKNRVLSGKPSQLGKLLIEDLCPSDVKLNGCHCDKIVWGMFREKIPIVIRNHIADMPFNKDLGTSSSELTLGTHIQVPGCLLQDVKSEEPNINEILKKLQFKNNRVAIPTSSNKQDEVQPPPSPYH